MTHDTIVELLAVFVVGLLVAAATTMLLLYKPGRMMLLVLGIAIITISLSLIASIIEITRGVW